MHEDKKIQIWISLADQARLKKTTQKLLKAIQSDHAGSKRWRRILKAIAKSEKLVDFGPEKIPLLNRDLYYMGDMKAGQEFARALDYGEHIPRNIERADKIHRDIFQRQASAAVKGDRGAMMYIADQYANGGRLPDGSTSLDYVNLERSQRIALHWWLRAAKSKRPWTLDPKPTDFELPLDDVSLDALNAIGNALKWEIGIPASLKSAELIFAFAAQHNSIRSEVSRVQLQHDIGTRWQLCGEVNYGTKCIKQAREELKALREAGIAEASFKNIGWFGSIINRNLEENIPNASARQHCIPSEDLFCFFHEQQLDELFSDLLIVSKAKKPEAFLIRSYRLLIFKRNMTELRKHSNIVQDQQIIDLSRFLWQQACSHGYNPNEDEVFRFSSQKQLNNIFLFKELLYSLSVEQRNIFETYINAIKDSIIFIYPMLDRNAVCPPMYSNIWAIFLRYLIEKELVPVDTALLDWCGLRYKLARLEQDIYSPIWRKTLIEAQIASVAITERLQQKKGKSEYRAERIEQLKDAAHGVFQSAFQRFSPSTPTLSIDPSVPAEASTYIRKVRKANRREEVFRSTRDIGIQYNRLDSKLGTPLPGQHAANDKRLKGWRRVDGIILKADGFDVDGTLSDENEIPLVIREDIEVLLYCQLIKGCDQSLSLEPLFGWTGTEIIDCQLSMKQWSPDWLSETELGRSLYYSDRLLGLDESGQTLVSQFEGPDDGLCTAEDLGQLLFVQPWTKAAHAGGIATTPNGRLMHTSLSMEWSQNPEPDISLKQSGVGRIPIPHVRSGVVGADIFAQKNGNYEDRRVGEGHPRFHRARMAAILTGNYDLMEKAFPVYRRTRQIQAINAGLYSARVNYCISITDTLKTELEGVQQRFEKARHSRLESGGLDVVIS